MLLGKKIVVVMPAYNAARTLERTFGEIPLEVVDEVLLVDDASADGTAELARRLGIRCVLHERNRGYGGNQKTCYREALKLGADIVVMLHPDYQYSPRLIPVLAGMVACGEYHACLGSRIIGSRALAEGMPLYKFVANRLLTLVQNLLLGSKLSEFHTGYRAYSREALERIPFESNSEDFVFDNQILAQIHYLGLEIGEISCRARYFPEASSIGFRRGLAYGLGVLGVSLRYLLHRLAWKRYRLLDGLDRTGPGRPPGAE